MIDFAWFMSGFMSGCVVIGLFVLLLRVKYDK